MTCLPPAPRSGDRISATLIREILRAIRSVSPIAGTGVKLSQGPNGTVINAQPANGGSAKTKDVGCFYIDEKEVNSSSASGSSGSSSGSSSSEATATVTFGNCYYRCGGMTYMCQNDELEATGGHVAALKVTITGSQPSAVLVDTTFADLVTSESNTDYYYLPLYKFDSDMNVECDFRNVPTAAMGEF